MSRCSWGPPEWPSNAGTTRDSASTSRGIARRSTAGHRLRWPRGPSGRRPVTRVHPAVPRSRGWHIPGATSIDVGGDPYRSMSLADVTGDGLADLITPNPDHVAVLVAEGDGGFRTRATLPAPFGPLFSVVAADLTGDGSAAVLVANCVGGEVAVLVGGGTPVLQRIEIVGNPYGLATGDCDEDGRVDFAVANDGVDWVSIFLTTSGFGRWGTMRRRGR